MDGAACGSPEGPGGLKVDEPTGKSGKKRPGRTLLAFPKVGPDDQLPAIGRAVRLAERWRRTERSEAVDNMGILKRFVKRHFFAPRGASIGSNSVVRRPWFWYNRSAIRIGNNVSIGRESLLEPIGNYAGVTHASCITVGEGTYIGRYCQLHAMNLIEIGDECVLSDHVYISDIAHGMEVIPTPIMKQPLESKGPVRIGRRVFIGYRASVLPGVILGDFCVVGTNAVVTRSFPAGSIIGGCPARLIRMRPGFDA